MLDERKKAHLLKEAERESKGVVHRLKVENEDLEMAKRIGYREAGIELVGRM